MVESRGRLAALVLALAAALAGDALARTATSLHLTGDGHVVVPDDFRLNPVGGITLEAWIRPTSFAGFPTIYGKSFTSGQWLGLSTSGVLRFYPSGAGSSVDGGSPVPLNTWTHVAVSYDPATGQRVYYQNGNVDLNLTAVPTPIRVGAADLGIGAEASGAFPFQGQISELRLWGSVRSQDEIRRDMWRMLTASDGPELLAVWPLDQTAGDALDRNPGELSGTASFAAVPAPPTPHGPARIRRMSTPASSDGLCDEAGYGAAQLLPLWYDDDPGADENPEYALVGARFDTVHICLGPRPIPPSGWIEVYLDGDGDGGGPFPSPGDYRFRVFQNGTVSSHQGIGNLLAWSSVSVPGFVGARALIGEFLHGYELTIPRSLITSPDGVFGLQIAEKYEAVPFGPIVTSGWPDDQVLDTPSSWEPAVIDDTPVPTDLSDPIARIGRVSPSERPSEGDPVSVVISAADGTDIQTVELWVDGAIAQVWDLVGPSDTTRLLTSDPLSLALGPHTLRARVVDHVGRQAWSAQERIRVVVDGEPPALELTHAPLEPAAGGTFTITATATDPSGVEQISVGDILGLPRICSFSGSATTESCELAIPTTPATRIVRYHATARDTEGMSARSPVRSVLVGNDGPDTDDDGVSDAHEALLCTSPLRPDSDGDALKDDWELVGIPDATRSSIIVDLPALGANPCHKDVFLQYDHEQGARVDAGAVEPVIQAYRARWIDLHVEENERPRVGGGTFSPIGANSGLYQTAGNDGEYWFAPARHWSHVYAFSRHFPGRSAGGDRQFRFDIYVGPSSGTCSGGANDTASCVLDSDCPGGSCTDVCACPTDGSADPDTCRDGTFGCWRESASGQARRFMHELGHAVGLGHGGRSGSRTVQRDGEHLYYGPGGSEGWDHVNWKPNYPSLMNYGANGGDLCRTPSGDLVSELDYSDDVLGDLLESDLDESSNPLTSLASVIDCSHADPGSVPVTIYTCTDPDEEGLGDDSGLRYAMLTDGTSTIARMPQNGSWDSSPPTHAAGVDFDCDGSIESSVQSNLNGDDGDARLPGEPCDGTDTDRDGNVDEGCDWSADGQVLRGRSDWLHVPSPAWWHIEYDLGDDCYIWPAAYRAAIGAHAIDRRPSGAPTGQCPDNPITYASGVPIDEPEDVDRLLPPGTEVCDGTDTDADGEIDEGCRDTDGDGLSDAVDNCPATPNADQADDDADLLGNACDDPDPVQPSVSFTGVNGTGLQWTEQSADLLGYNVYCELPSAAGAAFMGDVHPSTIEPFFNILPVAGTAGAYPCWVAPVDLRGREGEWARVDVVTEHDGDGITDDVDRCPYWAAAGQTDTDGNGIGDDCECGDQSGDGRVDVADILEINAVIFDIETASPLCDTNDDDLCNVADILGVNARIFGAPAHCARYPAP